MSGIKKYFATPNLQCKVNEIMESNEQEVSLRLNSKRSRNIKVKQAPLNVHSTYASTNSFRLIDEQGSALNSTKDISKKEIKTSKRKSYDSRKGSKNVSMRKSPQSEGENYEVCIGSAKSNIINDCKGTNAFQVMMDARNKSIGTNSPGKEREESEILTDRNKDIIAKRRIKFEAWAAEKGGLKRKMTEEVIDEHIKQEMNKRTKRLKKLLQNNSEEKRSNSKQTLCSENKAIQKASNDGDEKHAKKRRQIRKRTSISKAHLENVSTSTRKSNECNDNGIETNDNKITSLNLGAINVNSVCLNTEKGIIALSEDDKSNDAFLAKLNSPMKKNGNLLCYFGKIKSNEDENSLNEESTTVNVETKITSKEMSSAILKTPKSKAKLSTPGSKWKIRIVSSSLDCHTNSNSCCIDLSDSLSETEMSEKLEHSKSTHGSKTAENTNTNDIKYSKARKLAPLFEKAEKNVSNAKEIKAKEDFLKSGVPEKFRLMLEKQNSYDKISFPVFPSISHIQQSSDSYIWHLPKESLDFLHLTNNMGNESINLRSNYSSLRLGTFTQCNRLQCDNEKLRFNTNTYFPAEHFGKYKHVLKHIKSDFPEFPVYKTFRILREKTLFNNNLLNTQDENIESNATTNNSKSKKTKRSKKLKIEKKNNEDSNSECHKDQKNNFLWSDAFCPRNSEEFIGNSSAVNNLKDWLIQWKEFNVMKHKNSNYDSDCSYNSDADFSESNDSFYNSPNFKALKNTAVLLGPVGSGKTSTIYLLANELGYKVIELNASSKRTGKIAFTKLQEATQSHRVRSKDNISSRILESAVKSCDTKKRKIKTSLGYQLLSTLKTKNCDEGIPLRNGSSRVLSLILVEDIDIVFDQDDGFISALSQIIQTSKRPIVFTSSDENNLNVQKFMSNLVIKFKPANSRIMTTWLQILCLVNNLYIDSASILQLLDMYNGDMRKTLLQLQFWVLSGGDPHALPSKHCDSENKKRESEETIELYPDENLHLSGCEEELWKGKGEYICHKKCLLCTCSLKNTESCKHLFTLGYLWFDLSITKIHSKFESEGFQLKKHNQPLLSCVAEFFDTASCIDVMLTSIQVVKEKEMYSNFHIQNVKDYLLKKSYSRSAVDPHLHPKSKEDYSRFRQDIHHSVNVFSSATNERIPNFSKQLCDSPEHPKMSKALALDYVPTFRTICRAEKQKSETNMKRITSNRFYHYLKTLDVHFTDDILNFACSSLR